MEASGEERERERERERGWIGGEGEVREEKRREGMTSRKSEGSYLS